MNRYARDTLIDIARCEELKHATSRTSPCHKVLQAQPSPSTRLRQVPEPWRGRIDAPLMFISSNPSIDRDDDSPTGASGDEHLARYFSKGFPEEFPRIRLRNGIIRKQHVRFWASVRARAAELWEQDRLSIRPGVDFAITELVHCKSRKETGVKQAIQRCVELHWDNVQQVSKARVFVALGALVHRQLGIAVGDVRELEHPDGGPRWLLALPHPGAFGKKNKNRSEKGKQKQTKAFASRYRDVDLTAPKNALRATRIDSATQ